VSALLLFRAPAGAPPPAAGDAALPAVQVAFAWASNPLEPPTYQDATPYVRSVSTNRGRSFEYDRIETGVASYSLSNRDSRFDPDNAAGPYYPNVKPTRRVKVSALYAGTSYGVMQGFTEGYPNAFPADGYDAVVQQNASDWFYPLNAIKFVSAATTLASDMLTTPAAGTEEVIQVASIGLPMPQAFPFVVQIGSGAFMERLEVTGTPNAAYNQWTVKRGHGESFVGLHGSGDVVTSEEVRFAVEPSGTRINNCLDMLGIATSDRDIDAGNSTIAESDNLAGSTILDHLLLIAECENGRFFAARDGRITFRQRHWQYTDELTSRATFGADAGSGAAASYGTGAYGAGAFGTAAGEIPFLSGTGNVLAHDDAKIYNWVRITLPTGQIIEAFDQASIDAHFERVLDKQWPLWSAIEAQDAADYMLAQFKEARLRLPKIQVRPQDARWATVLGMDMAQRYRLKMDPPVGSTVVDEQVIVERVGHAVVPGDWRTSLEFSRADPNTYWRVEVSGQQELDTQTRLAY